MGSHMPSDEGGTVLCSEERGMVSHSGGMVSHSRGTVSHSGGMVSHSGGTVSHSEEGRLGPHVGWENVETTSEEGGGWVSRTLSEVSGGQCGRGPVFDCRH